MTRLSRRTHDLAIDLGDASMAAQAHRRACQATLRDVGVRDRAVVVSGGSTRRWRTVIARDGRWMDAGGARLDGVGVVATHR